MTSETSPLAAGPASTPVGPAALSPHQEAEALRLSQAGMGPDKIGARFRIPYAVIKHIVARERARRANNAEAAAREYEEGLI